MMTAKEMFENLGYSLEVNNKDLIKYSKEVCGYTFFRFRLKDKEFCSGYQSVAHTATQNELKAVIQQFKELGWIEEEKSETNLEFYYDDLIKEDCSDFGVVNGKIESCTFIPCEKCEFKHGNCHKNRITWLLSQRKKPKYKFTQFEYDLINTYRNVDYRCKFNGCYQLKILKEKGYFKNVDKDESIKDILENCEVIKND